VLGLPQLGKAQLGILHIHHNTTGFYWAIITTTTFDLGVL
jgi:hypothetical protein